MSKVEVTYNGSQQCTAIDTKSAKSVASDCSLTKGEEFGLESLVAAGLGSCMLISMSSFAERHGLDVSGAQVDVDTPLGGKLDMRITALDVTVRVPKSFTEGERAALEKAAAAYRTKHSFRPDTEISTHFEFGDASVEAA